MYALFESTRRSCRTRRGKKRIDVDVQQFIDVDIKRRELLSKIENLKALRNKTSRDIPKLQGDEKQEAIARMKDVAAESKELEGPLRDVEADFEALLLQMPNIPADDVPEGASDADNVELRTWGDIPKFDFEPRDHVELGELLDLIDMPRASKLAGSRTYFLKNAAVLLEQAVLQFALQLMVGKGFTPFIVPHLVRDQAMTAQRISPLGGIRPTACQRMS